MARGDLLLYRSDGTLPARLISWATQGPYVHCEVDLGDGTTIGALTRGVSHYIPTRKNLARAVVVPLNVLLERVETGIAWLQKQVGSEYGWVDIFNQALLFLKLPKLFFFIPGTFDRSDLVARYLEIAGGLDLGSLGDSPGLCSPNDIARAAGLLPPKP